MRQLVSVVSDGRVRYFIHDGDDVRQIAEITDPGADVATVIEIGVSLAALHGRRNGDQPKAKRRRPPGKKSAPAPTSPESVPAKKRGRLPGSARVDIDINEIIGAVRRQPGRTGAELGAELLPTIERIPANAAIGYRISTYLKRCENDGTAPAIRAESGPYSTSQRHYFPA